MQNDEITLVTSETRNVSDKKQLTYTEYSDGLIFLTITEDNYEAVVTKESYESSSYAVHETISIKGTSNVNQSYFILDDVSYTLINGDYDLFTNTGTMSTIVCCSVCKYYPHITVKESASGPASIVYRFDWVPIDESTFYNSLLTIEIQNNKVTIEHIRNN